MPPADVSSSSVQDVLSVSGSSSNGLFMSHDKQNKQLKQKLEHARQRQQKTAQKSIAPFRSVDAQSYPQVLFNDPSSPSNVQFTTAKKSHKPAIRHQHQKSTISQGSHHQNHNSLKQIPIKSQLQLGIKKLSVSKQNGIEWQEQFQNKKLEPSTHTKQRRNTHKSKNSRQVSFSQNSMGSPNSSVDFQDCLSRRTFNINKHKKQQESMGSSPTSSKYQLANDGDSLCSCCRDEVQTQKSYVLEKKKLTKSKSNIKEKKTVPCGSISIGKHGQSINNKIITSHRQTIDQLSREPSYREERVSKSREKKRTKSNSKIHEHRHVKSSLKQTRKDSNLYNQGPLSKSSLGLQSQQRYQNQWLSQNMPMNVHSTSIDQRYQYQPALIAQNQALNFSQNLLAPQVIQNSFIPQQHHQYSGYIGQQQIGQQNIPQVSQVSSQFQQQKSSVISHNALPLQQSHLGQPIKSPQNRQAVGFSPVMSSLRLESSKTLDIQKEQIEAIESLIKQAKQKIECSSTSSQQICTNFQKQISHQPFSDKTKQDKFSRNGPFKNHQASYNSNQDNISQNLMWNTQFSEISEDKQFQNEKIDYNIGAQDQKLKQFNPSHQVAQRRFSEQISNDMKFSHRAQTQEPVNMNQSKEEMPTKLEKLFNNSISSQGANTLPSVDNNQELNKQKGERHHNLFFEGKSPTNYEEYPPSSRKKSTQKEISIIDYDNDREVTKSVSHFDAQSEVTTNTKQQEKDVLWIDFNENKSIKKPPFSNKHGKHINQNKQESSTNKSTLNTRKIMPSSIPEEREEDFTSPNRQSFADQKYIAKQAKQEVMIAKLKPTHVQVASISLSIPQNEKQEISLKQKIKEAWAMDFSLDDTEGQKQTNLATAFKQNNLQQRLQQQESLKHKSPKKEYTKDELFKRKKELQKQARQKIQEKSKQETSKIESSVQEFKTQTTDPDKVPVQLLSRLSAGQRPEISKKDMIKLTSKNYEKLPEIREKKIQEFKKEETRKRIEAAKEQEKKRRQSQLQKRSQQKTNSISQHRTYKIEEVDQSKKL